SGLPPRPRSALQTILGLALAERDRDRGELGHSAARCGNAHEAAVYPSTGLFIVCLAATPRRSAGRAVDCNETREPIGCTAPPAPRDRGRADLRQRAGAKRTRIGHALRGLSRPPRGGMLLGAAVVFHAGRFAAQPTAGAAVGGARLAVEETE